MQIGLTVLLPVDADSVPFIRLLCRQALEHLRIDGDIIDETTLALNEACANVVQHAGPHDDYEVRVDIDDDRCRIQVTDQGVGFDPALLSEQRPADLLDGGSGLLLMRALVDTLQFEQDSEGRPRVTFVKRLASRQPLAVPPL
jgi:serine/threonine-protein kinase RsbW